MRMSPLNKLVYPMCTTMNPTSSKTTLATTNKQRASVKKQKTMTINRSRVSSETNNMMDTAVARTVKSMSPEPQKTLRPRKIRMPTVTNPDTLFMAKNSKNLLQRVKLNLRKICEVDQVGPDGQRIELLKWKSKYLAEIMDICLIEIVQIDNG